MMMEGVFTALVTPFKSGKVDYTSLQKLVEFQMKQGVKNFVVNGTTAESPTLREEESLEILTFVLEFVRKSSEGKNALVVFGSGSNNTEKTIEFSTKAKKTGAHGLLLVVPYYNKPPQAGLYQHFKKIAESVEIPQILYNVPGRTITSLELETIVELAKIPNIVSIKEASGQLEFGKKIIHNTSPEFTVLSGDDESCLDLFALGGKGVISVCSHIMPKKMSYWFSVGDIEKKQKDLTEGKELISSLYMSSNPIPVKAALHMMGLIESDEVRLPLCPLSLEQKKRLETVMKKYEGYLG